MPSERYNFLKSTLKEIESLTLSIEPIQEECNKSNAELKKIETKIATANQRLISHETLCEDYDKKKTKLENQVSEKVGAYENAKNSMLDHSISKLNSLTSKQFREEKFTQKSEEMKDESEWSGRDLVLGCFFAFIVAVLTIEIQMEVYPHPDFTCTEGDQKIPETKVLDGIDDCDDGSDEEETSIWNDDDSRVEEFRNDTTETDLIFMGICLFFAIPAFLVPFMITKQRGGRVAIFQEKFESKYGLELTIAESLEEESRKSKLEASNAEKELKELIKAKAEIPVLKSRIERCNKNKITIIETINQQNKQIDNLNSQAEEKWETIADLVPYGNKIL